MSASNGFATAEPFASTLAGAALDRAAWLDERSSGVGASEAASALGCNPHESPLELYLRKLGLLPPIDETEAMAWGKRLEPLLEAEYVRRTGNAVARRQVFVRSEAGPLFATLDAVTQGGWPVEFKTIGQRSAGGLGEESTDEIPEPWLIQAQAQMACFPAPMVEFAVLVGGQEYRTYTVHHSPDLERLVVAGARAFWDRVTAKNPPDDLRPSDFGLMKHLHPGCEGVVDLGGEGLGLTAEYEQWTERAKRADEERSRLKARIAALMGEAELGLLPGGRKWRRKLVRREAYTVGATQYIDMRLSNAKGGS